LTLEGLLLAHSVFQFESWSYLIGKGLKFYRTRLFSRQHRARWRASYGWKDIRRVPYRKWIADQIVRILFLDDLIPEAQLSSYAAAIRVFSMANQIELHWLDEALSIYNRLHHNLADTPESGSQSQGDQRLFIRHQAHLFDAMGQLALTLCRK
jgi:hypothetical protein